MLLKPIGNCLVIFSWMVHVWNFRQQGPWDKGPRSPGSSPPANHCQASPWGETESKELFDFSADLDQICHAWQALGTMAYCPSIFSGIEQVSNLSNQRPPDKGRWWGSAPHRPSSGLDADTAFPDYTVLETFSFLSRSAPNLASVSLGSMGVRPPILRRIRQIWYFSLAGSWVKGQMRTSSPRGLLADEDELAARAPCHRLVGPGKRLSPRNFFNFRPIWTKFYLLVTWNHGRLPIDFDQNRTGLIFFVSAGWGQGGGEAAMAAKLARQRANHWLNGPGKLHSPQNFFIPSPICLKFGTHNHDV